MTKNTIPIMTKVMIVSSLWLVDCENGNDLLILSGLLTGWSHTNFVLTFKHPCYDLLLIWWPLNVCFKTINFFLRGGPLLIIFFDPSWVLNLKKNSERKAAVGGQSEGYWSRFSRCALVYHGQFWCFTRWFCWNWSQGAAKTRTPPTHSPPHTP